MVISVNTSIHLRLVEPSDALDLFLLTDSSRQYLRQWLPWVDVTVSASETEKFILAAIEHYQAGRQMHFGIWKDDVIQGMVGFNALDRTNRVGSMGYWLGKSHQGMGIMTLSCSALVDYGFNVLTLNRIQLAAAPRNSRSRAVAQRLGFREEGILRENEWLYDYFVDHVIYAVLAKEWKPIHYS